jgi:hypothetical protein
MRWHAARRETPQDDRHSILVVRRFAGFRFLCGAGAGKVQFQQLRQRVFLGYVGGPSVKGLGWTEAPATTKRSGVLGGFDPTGKSLVRNNRNTFRFVKPLLQKYYCCL